MARKARRTWSGCWWRPPSWSPSARRWRCACTIRSAESKRGGRDPCPSSRARASILVGLQQREAAFVAGDEAAVTDAAQRPDVPAQIDGLFAGSPAEQTVLAGVRPVEERVTTVHRECGGALQRFGQRQHALGAALHVQLDQRKAGVGREDEPVVALSAGAVTVRDLDGCRAEPGRVTPAELALAVEDGDALVRGGLGTEHTLVEVGDRKQLSEAHDVLNAVARVEGGQ